MLLTADAAKSVVDQTINMSGYIQARTVGASHGVIILDGGSAGSTAVSGTIDASGPAAGQTGGAITITGEDVSLFSGARLDASGDSGGGTVLVGGDPHGAGPLQDASTTEVAPGALIRADAVTSGQGGSVTVWSEDQTVFDGAISARGGASGGDGGSAEVSGQNLLSFLGTVDLRAPNGQAGVLLLDPENVMIAATGDMPGLPASSSAPITLNPTADDSVIQASTLEQALGLASVTVATGSTGTQPGDITVATNVSWSNGNSLTLSANRSVVIDDAVTIANTGAGNLNLRADSTGSGVGTVTFNGSGKVDYTNSTGLVSIFYNPSDNQAGSAINATSYTSPTNYGPSVLTNGAVSGQLTAYMLVNTVYDLQDIANNLAGDYALGSDVDASATASWNSGAGFVPIGDYDHQFVGQLNGLGRAITNLTIDSQTTDAGLFGYIGATGVVSNVNLTSSAVTGSFISGTLPTNPTINQANVDGGQFIGALAGQNNGTIANSSVSGTAAATSWGFVGGLVGWNQGSITTSTTQGSVSISASPITLGSAAGGLVADNQGLIVGSSSRSDVSGWTGRLGGLTGVNDGSISNDFALGSVTSESGDLGGTADLGGLTGLNGGSISNAYAFGSVTGESGSIGGLVGYDQLAGTISSSYAAGKVQLTGSMSGPPNNVGGLVGLDEDTSVTIGAMHVAHNVMFSPWDTDTTGQDAGIPRLRASSSGQYGRRKNSRAKITTSAFSVRRISLAISGTSIMPTAPVRMPALSRTCCAKGTW